MLSCSAIAMFAHAGPVEPVDLGPVVHSVHSSPPRSSRRAEGVSNACAGCGFAQLSTGEKCSVSSGVDTGTGDLAAEYPELVSEHQQPHPEARGWWISAIES